MSTSIIRFAKSTSAVESGFIAAGVTVSTVAAVQSLAAVMTWIIFGV